MRNTPRIALARSARFVPYISAIRMAIWSRSRTTYRDFRRLYGMARLALTRAKSPDHTAFPKHKPGMLIGTLFSCRLARQVTDALAVREVTSGRRFTETGAVQDPIAELYRKLSRILHPALPQTSQAKHIHGCDSVSTLRLMFRCECAASVEQHAAQINILRSFNLNRHLTGVFGMVAGKLRRCSVFWLLR